MSNVFVNTAIHLTYKVTVIKERHLTRIFSGHKEHPDSVTASLSSPQEAPIPSS